MAIEPLFQDLVPLSRLTGQPGGLPLDPQAELERAQKRFALLLPVANIELTEEEARRVSVYQEARLILGAAGASPMVCAANCPFIDTCELALLKKAPYGSICPFEANYVSERFLAWMQEFGVTVDTVLESERATISNLVYLDLQEQRCVKLLARASNAGLVSRSVRDVDEEGEPVAWEDVIHINAQRLEQITTQRRMLLRDFELTREAQTRKKKSLGIRSGDDLSTRQSGLRDRLNQAMRSRVVDVK